MGFGMQWHRLYHMHMGRENYVTDGSCVRRTSLRSGSHHHTRSVLVHTDWSCHNGTADLRHDMLYTQSHSDITASKQSNSLHPAELL